LQKVVLTFDDGLASHLHVVAPLLKKYGFGGSFYITGKWVGTGTIRVGRPFKGPRRAFSKRVLTWEEVKELDQMGLEVGSHNWEHFDCTKRFGRAKLQALTNQKNRLCEAFEKFEITEPTTFAYPGFHQNQDVQCAIGEIYDLARSGCEYVMNFDDFQNGGSGCPCDPKYHSRTQIPCLGVFGRNYGYEDFIQSLKEISDDQVGVFCFHDVLEVEEVVIDTSIDTFRRCLEHLWENKYRVINLRDCYSEGMWNSLITM